MLMLEHNFITGTLPDLCSSLNQLEVSWTNPQACSLVPVMLD
jgi:hypothetical protein